MFAKVIIICVALAAAHASFLAPVGYGAPVLTAGPLGVGKGIFAAPAVATVSSQKSVIDHVAPAVRVSVAPAPIAFASHGIIDNRLVDGHGIAAAPLAVGTGIYGAPAALGVRNLNLGHGVAVSSQKSVINHVAPAAPVAVAAPVAFASHGIYGNGIVAGNSLLANGLVGGHGISASSLAVGHGLLGAPVALGHGAAVSSQKSVISHVAPAARVAVAATPINWANTGFISNGLIGGHGIVGNGLIAGAPLGIAGHGISALPLSIGNGIHGASVSLGLGKDIL